MTKQDFLNQTKQLRSYPHHIKYTLFANQRIKEMRSKEFSLVVFLFDECMEKAHKLYRRGKFRESIDSYIEAYSLINWIDFKNSTKFAQLFQSPNPILDCDIIEGRIKLDEISVEEDLYIKSLSKVLLCLSYAYMELRHYSAALDCLDESILLFQDEALPDIYFRRSQVRLYNKFSQESELVNAISDIQKAKALCKQNCPEIYEQHYQILMKYTENKKHSENFKLLSKSDKLFKF
jgi:tetratricopeptide (TPR) repeat protein